MDRSEQLTVWQQEIAALRRRIAEGRSIVGHTERVNYVVLALENAEDFLRLEIEGGPFTPLP